MIYSINTYLVLLLLISAMMQSGRRYIPAMTLSMAWVAHFILWAVWDLEGLDYHVTSMMLSFIVVFILVNRFDMPSISIEIQRICTLIFALDILGYLGYELGSDMLFYNLSCSAIFLWTFYVFWKLEPDCGQHSIDRWARYLQIYNYPGLHFRLQQGL